MLYTCEIVFNIVSEAANDMFTLTNTLYSNRTRGHPDKLYLDNSVINVRKHFFVNVISFLGTIGMQQMNIFLVFLHLNVISTRLI